MYVCVFLCACVRVACVRVYACVRVSVCVCVRACAYTKIDASIYIWYLIASTYGISVYLWGGIKNYLCPTERVRETKIKKERERGSKRE